MDVGHWTGFGLPLAWTLAVLAAWIGYGAAAARWAGCGERAGLALCAGWGAAVCVAVGGVFNALRVCSRGSLAVVTLAGVGLAGWELWRRRPTGWRRPAIAAAVPTALILAYGAVVLVGGLGLRPRSLNFWDDQALYTVLPKKMLEAGAADDPLNQRRLSTYGGFAVLQAQLDIVGDGSHPFLLDRGVMAVLAAGLVIGRLSPRAGGRWLDAAVIVACLLYPIPRANTAAEWAVTVMALTIARTLMLADEPADDAAAPRRLRLLALAALAGTAGGTFRANVLALPPLLFGVYFVVRLVSRRRWRETATEVAVVVGVGCLALLPWAVALHHACGAYLFPLTRGNDRTADAGFGLARQLGVAWAVLTTPKCIVLYLPAVATIMLRQWTVLWLYLAAVVVAVATVCAYPGPDNSGYERYCVPLLLAPALLALAAGLRARAWQAKPGLIVLTLVMLGVIDVVAEPWPTDTLTTQLSMATQAALRPYRPFEELRPAYAAVQQAVPAGATLATALDVPMLLDFSRNPVWCLDVPARAWKTGIWPVGQGPDALRRFLAEQGVDYVAWQDFTQTDRDGIYYAATQVNFLAIDRNAARTLAIMGDLERLRHTPAMVYDQGGYRVAKLR